MNVSRLLQDTRDYISSEHMTEEELVNDLWTSHFNK